MGAHYVVSLVLGITRGIVNSSFGLGKKRLIDNASGFSNQVGATFASPKKLDSRLALSIATRDLTMPVPLH
jgi:hypothetical protein